MEGRKGFARVLDLYDAQDNVIATLQKKTWTWHYTYNILQGDKLLAQVVRQGTFRPKFQVSGFGWNVEGNFGGREYVISSPEEIIATIHWSMKGLKDRYQVDIPNPANELGALLVVLAIDCIVADQAAAAAAAT